MNFFERLANVFNPGRNVGRAMGNLASAEQQRRFSLLDTYLPSQSFVGVRSTSRDKYLFSGEAMKDASRSAVAMQFKSEYGEDLLPEYDEGFAAQKPRLYDLLAKQESEIKSNKSAAQTGVEAMRRARMGNMTGGVRNGVARNPFNMNMLRGPMNTAPARPATPTAPAQQRYIGGGGGMPSDGRQFNLL